MEHGNRPASSARAIALAALVVGCLVTAAALASLLTREGAPTVAVPPDATAEELAAIGSRIARGKGRCFTCHPGPRGRGLVPSPDLDGVAARAATRVEGQDALEYLARSIYEPDAHVAAGFRPGMPRADLPPIGLSDREILAVLAWLESLGGRPSVTATMTRAELGLER